MENNRQFDLMRSAARQKLEGADPVQLSVLTGLCWDGTIFDAETLGIPIRISWPECQISPELEMWHDLTILQYLANTKGTMLVGKFLALSEFHSGGAPANAQEQDAADIQAVVSAYNQTKGGTK